MNTRDRIFLITGAGSLTAAAILGAYGVHGLTDAAPAQVSAWGWAVQMQSYHSLGLVLIAVLGPILGGSWPLRAAGVLIIAGIVLFSGSIYAVTLGAPAAVAQVAPAGGSSFMLAWILVAIAAYRTAPRSESR